METIRRVKYRISCRGTEFHKRSLNYIFFKESSGKTHALVHKSKELIQTCVSPYQMRDLLP